MEARIVGAAGIKFAAIRAGKFRRYHSDSALAKVFNLATLGPNARDAVRTMQGVSGALRLLRQFKPDVVFLKGGYVCLPVGLAARLLHIPYVIHESDMAPGLANRILSRWATKIAVGFPAKSYKMFAADRLVYTGNPVPADRLRAHRLEGLAAFRLKADVPTILVIGGSQGAAQINDVVVAALPALLEHYQVIHQAGESDYSRLQFELSREEALPHPERYHLKGFIAREMAAAYAAADVVVSRAGANSIADLAIMGKPTVLIPNYEMAGHQVDNARTLARAGAVRVLDGRTVTPAQLVGELKRILDDPEEQGRLSKAISQFARPDAAQELAKVIFEVGRLRAEERRVGEPDPQEAEEDSV